MKILFIIPSYKPAYIYGGTTVVISKLAEQLVIQGNDVTVYTTTANGKAELDVVHNAEIMVNGVKVYYFSRITGDHTHVSTKLFQKLIQTVKDFDIVHIHSWWSLLIFGAAHICKLKGVKPIISPHGMISSYTFGNQNIGVKKVLHKSIGRRLLESSYLHACTPLEWRDSLLINPQWKGFIASNLIDLPSVEIPRSENNLFTISFLSRVDPKKNLEILIKALADAKFDFRLKIAGSGEREYLDSLKKLVKEAGIEEQCEWVGWKSGQEKFEFLAESDLFVLPSFNENFAIVVTEALAVGTPVLLSEGVGLADYVRDNNFGWISKIGNLTDLSEKLGQAFNEHSKRRKIIEEAPAKIRQDFSAENLTNIYLTHYKQLSHKK